jgi:outer membrane protein assembly factor BamE (lipoprotein component of BamABCDE complex)
MKATSIFKLTAAALCAALLVSCTTPESRIRQSPDVFARLNPDEQALVKAGKVAVGFDMDAVKLALGDPDRIVIHTDATGSHQVWHYITYEDYQGGIIFAGYYHRYRGWGGPYFYAGAPYYNGYPARVHERTRVVFSTANTVSSIEEEKP